MLNSIKLNRIRFLCFLMILFSCAIALRAAMAAGSMEARNSNDKIIASLIDAVQSRASWHSVDGKKGSFNVGALYAESLDSEESKKHFYSIKEKSPDFAEYVYRQKGLPDPHAVHKWTGSIKIGLGWQEIRLPTDGEGATAYIPFGLGLYDKKRIEPYPFFKEQILTMIPVLEELTGLKISFVDPEDPQELTEHYARIRIVPMVDPQKWRKRDAGSSYLASSIEEALDTAVRVESNDPHGMDGFFIPEADNSISYAACKIDPTLKQATVKQLISECLMSVLGLPGRSNGDSSLLESRERMLSVLYCGEIKAGMNLYELIKTLKINNNCFSRMQR